VRDFGGSPADSGVPFDAEVPAGTSPADRPRGRLLALAALLLAALSAGGCDDDGGEAPEADDRVIVKLSFDHFGYVDAAVPTRKIIERVRHENESIFSSLRRADVMITAKKLVDVDLAHLEKDPVTVVDPASGITRAAQRVRYHFVALALAPKALVQRGDLRIAALHGTGPASVESVLADCSANGDRERAAAAEPWTVFDGRMERCKASVIAEQSAIDAARKKLLQPAKEIVSAEFERVYVPVTVRLRERNEKGEAPVRGEHVEGKVKTPQGPWASGDGPGADGDQPAWRWVDKSAERDFEDTEDEKDLQRMARPFGGASAPGGTRSWSTNSYLAPNFTLLYVVLGALIIFLVSWFRQQQRRR